MNRSAERKEALKIKREKEKNVIYFIYIYSSKLSARRSLTVSRTRTQEQREGQREVEKYLSLMLCCNIMGDTETFLLFDGKQKEDLQQDLRCVIAQVSLHLAAVFTANVFFGLNISVSGVRSCHGMNINNNKTGEIKKTIRSLLKRDNSLYYLDTCYTGAQHKGFLSLQING